MSYRSVLLAGIALAFAALPLYADANASDPSSVPLLIRKGRKDGLIDRSGKILAEMKYDRIGKCSEGLCVAMLGGKCGFLDTTGKIVCWFDQIWPDHT